MNRFKFLLATIVVAVLTLGIYSCQKEGEKIENYSKSNIKWRSDTPNIEVVNSMLNFEDYNSFETYIKKMIELENDSIKVVQAYNILGIDWEQEFLPNLTDFPVSLALEQQYIGFTSARKVEEDIINEALNSGDGSIFTLVHQPYLKSALNQDMSVKIGNRIFKYFDNSGVVIVLNSNWDVYNQIKNLPYIEIKSQPDVFVTNDDINNWADIYNLDADGRILSEKEYIEPNINISESPLRCEFDLKAFRVSKLANNRLRVELLSNKYDIYEWRFEDGSVVFGNPLEIDCNQRRTGKVCLTVYRLDPSVPTGRRAVCDGCIDFVCSCGTPDRTDRSREFANAGGSGKTIRIDASIWANRNDIGCRSRHFGRNVFGIWVPLSRIYHTSGIFANIVGQFEREPTPDTCFIVNQPFTESRHPGGNNFVWELIIPYRGQNNKISGALSSGHRLRLRQGNQPLGTFFGFGVDAPRLVLE